MTSVEGGEERESESEEISIMSSGGGWDGLPLAARVLRFGTETSTVTAG